MVEGGGRGQGISMEVEDRGWDLQKELPGVGGDRSGR